MSVEGQRILSLWKEPGQKAGGQKDGVRGGREERATSGKELDAESGENSCVFPNKAASLEVPEEDLCPWPQVRGLWMSMTDSPALCVGSWCGGQIPQEASRESFRLPVGRPGNHIQVCHWEPHSSQCGSPAPVLNCSGGRSSLWATRWSSPAARALVTWPAQRPTDLRPQCSGPVMGQWTVGEHHPL